MIADWKLYIVDYSVIFASDLIRSIMIYISSLSALSRLRDYTLLFSLRRIKHISGSTEFSH